MLSIGRMYDEMYVGFGLVTLLVTLLYSFFSHAISCLCDITVVDVYRPATS